MRTLDGTITQPKFDPYDRQSVQNAMPESESGAVHIRCRIGRRAMGCHKAVHYNEWTNYFGMLRHSTSFSPAFVVKPVTLDVRYTAWHS
jgi:hypothetical protein